MLGELTYSCLAGIDRNAYFSCYLNDFFQKLQQELLALMDNVAIVHIPPVELYAPDNLYVIVNPNRISNTSGLCHLISNVEVLCHKLFARKKRFVYVLIDQRIKEPVHTVLIFIVRHIRHIYLRAVNGLSQQPQSVFIIDILLKQPQQHIMSDIVVILREVNQKDISLV